MIVPVFQWKIEGATLQLCINSGYTPADDIDDETADLHRQIYRKDYLVEEAFAIYNE